MVAIDTMLGIPKHFWAGLEQTWLFQAEKILPTTVPLDTSGRNFRVGLGPGLGLGGIPMRFVVQHS
jgi:hypothetical protein